MVAGKKKAKTQSQRTRSVEEDVSKVRTMESVNTLNVIFLEWLETMNRVVYGNTAINAILPPDLQFFSNHMLPDYDVLSPDADADVRSLVETFSRRGHRVAVAVDPEEDGCRRVFVNAFLIARVTDVPKSVYARIHANALQGGTLRVAPADYLRMALLFELTRQTSASSWNDTFDKLLRINRAFNLDGEAQCEPSLEHDKDAKDALEAARAHLKKSPYVLCGYAAAAMALADGKWKPDATRIDAHSTCLDVLATNPTAAANEFSKIFRKPANGPKITVTEKRKSSVYPRCTTISLDGRPFMGFIHADKCLPYVQVEGLRIATMDTLLALYLRAFILDKPTTNLRCLCDVLAMHQHNRFNSQNPIFKRYVAECYGRRQATP